MRASVVSGALGVLLAVYFAGCGSSGDNGTAGNGGNGVGGSAAKGGTGNGGGGQGGSGGIVMGGGGMAGTAAGGAAGAGNSSGSGGFGADAGLKDVTFTYDGPVDDDSGNFDVCAPLTVTAQPLPLDMLIMQDNSGSMNDPQSQIPPNGDCNIGQSVNSKWCYTVNALHNFFTGAPAGTGVALNFFPKCWNPQSTSQCQSGASCSTPEVPLGQLPGNLTQLDSALNSNVPQGGTPTEAAIRGMITFTNNAKQAGRVMIGVLVTDGVPTSCDTNANNLATLLQNHLANDGIKTFVIGMTGANYNTLDTIAAPGGAPQHSQYCGGGINPCYHYDVQNGNSAAFNAVLQAIQQAAIGCQFTVPPPDGGLIDYSKAKVQYSAGGSPPAQDLNHVNDATGCTAAGGGWYYDNNSNPTTINLCPSTCSVVQLDSSPQIDIALGCQGS